MATIKIKFKDGFNLSTNVDVSINFVCSGIPYQRIQVSNDLLRYQDISGDWVTCCNEIGWTNNKYKIIEIDTSQASFSNFITAFKSNIEGVELEAGTYKWGITDVSSYIDSRFDLNFVSNSTNYTSLYITNELKFFIDYNNDRVYNTGTWYNDNHKTIVLNTNQYVPYDFYNYAILGGNLVKQATEITYTCKWYLDGTLVNTSTFTHEQLTGVDYNVLGSVFKVMLSATTLAQYDYGVNLNGETSNASLGSDNVITIEAFKSNIVFNITSNGTTTLATKNTYVPSDIDFNVNVPSVPLQDSKLVELNMADGSNQNVVPDTSYTAMKQVIIVKPTALVAGNIRNGISIAGISGSFTADANALSGNILSGKTAYVRGSKVTGSIPTYSGATTITSNGTISVGGKYLPSNIVVNVPSTPTQEKSVTITENGTTEVTPDSGKNLSKVTVITNVAGITEIATSSAMDTALVAENVGKYYKYTGTTDDKYTNGDIYQVQEG